MDESKLIMMPIMYLNCAFEISLLYVFFDGLFQVHEERKRGRILMTLLCTTMMFLANNYGLHWLNLICVPIIFFIYVQVLYRLEIKYALLYTLFYYVIGAGTEFVTLYVYKILGMDVLVVDFGRLFLLLVQDIFQFLIVQVIIKEHQVAYGDNSYRYLKSLFLLPITTLILLNGYLIPDTHHMIGPFLICIGGIFLILSNMFYFVIVETLLKALSEAKDKEMLEMKSRLESRHYQRLEETNRDYAKYNHEMKHILRTMKQLALSMNSPQIEALLNEVPKRKLPDRRTYCGDLIMDAILEERNSMAKDKGIIFNTNIQLGINITFIDDMDKISMFGNLLDNALEAAETSENGHVKVSLFIGNEAMVIFGVENNFKHKPKKIGKEYLTIKKMKKEHGFGISEVRRLSEKYGGTLGITEGGNTFEALLILSNVSNPAISKSC